MILADKTAKSAKLKPLKPNLRIKTRYLVFEILHENAKKTEVIKLIKEVCKKLYGEIGFAAMDFRKITLENNKGIIMINRKSVDKLKTSFVFLNKEKKLGIVSRYVSGSLKKAKTYL